MKTTEKIRAKLENNNGLYLLLEGMSGVKDYYSDEWVKAIDERGGGFDFDLMYDADENEFASCIEGQGELFEQCYNMILIGTVSAQCVEDLELTIEHYLEQQEVEKVENYLIVDATCNHDAIYIGEGEENCKLEENAMVFSSEKDAQKYIDDAKWGWAVVQATDYPANM